MEELEQYPDVQEHPEFRAAKQELILETNNSGNSKDLY